MDFDQDKLLRDGGEPRLGPRAGARAPRQSAAARGTARREDPRLPLRGRPVGALPAPPAPGGRAPRRAPARPLPQASRALVPGGRAQRTTWSASCTRCSSAARAGSAWRRPPMSTLLIDNYDSYTYNVFHLLAAVSGEEPIVIHNDMVSWRALSRWDFDAIVLSPGPGRPERWHDFGVCADILRSSDIPVLGVCLGHQGLGHVLNGMVASAPMVDARAPEQGRARRQRPVRGHPAGLLGRALPLARGHRRAGARGPRDGVDRRGRRDGHRTPHAARCGACSSTPSRSPPSTAAGWSRTSTRSRASAAPRARRAARQPAPPAPRPRARTTSAAPIAGVSLQLRTIEGEPSTELLFERLFGGAEHAFWLDSADAPTRASAAVLLPGHERRRPDRCVLEYDVERRARHRPPRAGRPRSSSGIDLRRARPRARRAARSSRRRSWPAACSAACRLPRLRVQGRLRLPQRAPLGRPGRGADARQPRRRGRPREPPHARCSRVCDGDEHEAERWLAAGRARRCARSSTEPPPGEAAAARAASTLASEPSTP